MKRDRAIACLWGSFLGALMGIAVAGAMATGLRLTVEDLPKVYWLCILVSALAGLCLYHRRGGWILLAVSGLGLLGLWRKRKLLEAALALLNRICYLYNGAYGWGIPDFTRGHPGPVDRALLVIGCATALAVAVSVSRRKGAGLPLMVAAVPVMSCFVVTDTTPDSHFLFLWLLGALILLLSGNMRRQDCAQGNTLTAMAAIAGAAALGLLFWMVPREGYENQPAQLQEKITTWIEQLPETLEQLSQGDWTTVITPGTPEELSLSAVGPKEPLNTPVMEVDSPISGPVYLRGRDYDSYDGTGWTSTEDRSEVFTESTLSTYVGWISISTRQKLDICYVPYYPSAAQVFTGGCLKNGEGETDYHFSMRVLPEHWKRTVRHMGYSTAPSEKNLALPESTWLWAKPLAEEITGDSSDWTERADKIADYVRNSATYDLDAPRMPLGEGDFARWFLEESDTGYCVHFATAAVVLLRAAGIEARYVEGYMTTVTARTPATIRERHAHAWAEYYSPGLRTWVVLEATPGDGLPAAAPEETPETTLPAQSTAPEETIPRETAPIKKQEETFTLPAGFVKALVRLLGAALTICAVPAQRKLRLHLRQRKETRGITNQQLLARWQTLAYRYRRLGQAPPEEMENLAQRAKYSPHAITPEELAVMDAALASAEGLLRERAWYRRLMDRYIFAAY